ncbi:hypothetical protein IKQ26_01440 [bacterium]|nr:hypothetical protein [bacterium]
MSMNWSNFINNFLKPEIQDTLRNLQNTGSSSSSRAQNLESETQQTGLFRLSASTPQANTPQQTTQTQFPVGEFLFNAEVSQLEQQQTTQMIKELFQLPKEITEFLQQAVNQGKNSEVMELLGVLIDLNQLSSMLQQNGKNALSKLYQIIAEYNRLGVSMKGQEITELAKVINMAIRQVTSTDVQTLKTVMLLYLPWLPLTDNEAFKLEITEKKEESASDSEDNITLLISTVNYSNLQAAITKTGQDSVNVNVICSEDFPSNDLKNGLDEKSIKFNVPIKFESKIQENAPKEKNEERKMKIFMNTSPGVNPFLLLVANSVLNIVHNIDDMNTLREKRSRRI